MGGCALIKVRRWQTAVPRGCKKWPFVTSTSTWWRLVTFQASRYCLMPFPGSNLKLV